MEDGIFGDMFDADTRMPWAKGPTLHNPDNAEFHDHAFAFWIEDCFDPPVTIIWARSFEDAYEEFLELPCCECLLISADDLKDYLDENGEYQGNYIDGKGEADTESVNGRQLY